MLAEAMYKAIKSLDEARKSKNGAAKELRKAIEAGNEVTSNYPKAVSNLVASPNLSLDISEIISASYSPRNL